MNVIEQEANAFVAEMMDLGANFELSDSGPGGETRWFYSARPGMRAALRRFKSSIDLTKPGFEHAMINTIRRLKTGAPS